MMQTILEVNGANMETQPTRKVPSKGTPERREYNRTAKQNERDRERQRRDKAIEALAAAQKREERVRRNLHFYGEETPGHDARTHAEEIQVHREFLRALAKPDVQPGETLRMVANRTYDQWLVGRYAGGDAGGYYVPAFNRTSQRFDPDFGFKIDGKPFEEVWTPPKDCNGNEPINVLALPELPKLPGSANNQAIQPQSNSKPEPSDDPIEQIALKTGRAKLLSDLLGVPADALQYLNGGKK
jgi:hypothetical protein